MGFTGVAAVDESMCKIKVPIADRADEGIV